MATGEYDLIRRFRDLLPGPPGDLVIGPGDDCAAFDGGDGRLWLMTCDALVDGRHFRMDRIDPEALGRCLAAVNLSDIAAMGGTPRFALVSLVLPAGFDEEASEALVRGVSSELGRYGACIAGGNLSGGDELVADMTLVGEVPSEQVIRRTGAQPGDSILVTGRPGSSAAGLAVMEYDGDTTRFADLVQAHSEPQARVEAGRAIAVSGLATAMIDLSDGLIADLGHLCTASGVGAEIRTNAMDLGQSLQEAGSFTGIDPLRWVLSGGEDYELLFTAPSIAVAELATIAAKAGECPVTVIGTIAEVAGEVRCLDEGGADVTPNDGGWDHFRSDNQET